MSIKDLLEIRKRKQRAQAVKKAAKKVAAGAAAGAVAGVAAGILLAPRTGKESRAKLAKSAKKAVAAVKQKIGKKSEEA
jgi:gas vesicle protein